MDKFGEEKTLDTLMVELSQIKMNDKEHIKDFNQRFTTLINKFHVGTLPSKVIRIGFYMRALPLMTTLFVKRSKKETLDEAFEESLSMDQDMMSLKGNLTEEKKPSLLVRKQTPQTNAHSDAKKDDVVDLESLHRIIKTLSNEIIYLNKSNGEDSSSKKQWRSFKKPVAPTPPPLPTPNTIGLVFEQFAMHNYCHEHQDNHSYRECA